MKIKKTYIVSIWINKTEIKCHRYGVFKNQNRALLFLRTYLFRKKIDNYLYEHKNISYLYAQINEFDDDCDYFEPDSVSQFISMQNS